MSGGIVWRTDSTDTSDVREKLRNVKSNPQSMDNDTFLNGILNRRISPEYQRCPVVITEPNQPTDTDVSSTFDPVFCRSQSDPLLGEVRSLTPTDNPPLRKNCVPEDLSVRMYYRRPKRVVSSFGRLFRILSSVSVKHRIIFTVD